MTHDIYGKNKRKAIKTLVLLVKNNITIEEVTHKWSGYKLFILLSTRTIMQLIYISHSPPAMSLLVLNLTNE